MSGPRLEAATLRHVLAGYDNLRSIGRGNDFRATLLRHVHEAEAREVDSPQPWRMSKFVATIEDFAERVGQEPVWHACSERFEHDQPEEEWFTALFVDADVSVYLTPSKRLVEVSCRHYVQKAVETVAGLREVLNALADEVKS